MDDEPLGWREREFRSLWLDAKRLDRRMPGVWVYDPLGALGPPERRRKMQRLAGNVLLENVTASAGAGG